jgi:hypothetical protein
MDAVGDGLANIRWEDKKLEPIEKDFYEEHPDVAARSDEVVTLFRQMNNITIKGNKVPSPVTTFAEAGFPEYLMKEVCLTISCHSFQFPRLLNATMDCIRSPRQASRLQRRSRLKHGLSL